MFVLRIEKLMPVAKASILVAIDSETTIAIFVRDMQESSFFLDSFKKLITINVNNIN
jgi:hypothetical protein